MPTDPAPQEIIEEALCVLDEHLHLSEVEGPTTHVAVRASDLENPAVPPALGRYFVGVVAGVVDEDASLSEELLATEPDSVAEVRSQIERMIGPDNNFLDKPSRRFRDRVRNPYIAEIIAHALIVLRKRRDTACLIGPPAALKNPHVDPRRQGLDLIGIYNADGLPAAAIGEAKSSRQYGSRRLKEAAKFFSAIDAGKRGVELRSELGALKHVLDDGLRSGLADGFWRSNCCYLPVIVFSTSIDETADNPDLDDLRPDPPDIRLIALQLQSFHVFFNEVAEQIRVATNELLTNV
jgi:hypothetical protein